MWDLTDLFNSNDELNNAIIDISNRIKSFSKYYNCIKNCNNLLDFLKEKEEIDAIIERMNSYIYASFVIDYNNKIILELSSKLNELKKEYNNSISFFYDELLKIDGNSYKSLFSNDGLKVYKPYLDSLYNNSLNKNRISYKSSRNKIINDIKEYGTIFIDNNEITVNKNNYNKLMNNKDSKIREEVYKNYINKISEKQNDIVDLLNKQINDDIILSKNEDFNSFSDYYLSKDGLPLTFLNSLINNIESNLSSYHKYFKINSKLFGKTSLLSSDLNYDFLQLDKNYTIDEAKRICLNAIKPLGDDYCNRFNSIFENNDIDYIPRDNKMIQYACISCMDRNPKVIINFFNDFKSIQYLIHECGHHVHHQYINENNHLIYRNISSLISEIAALTNELLLVDYIYKESKNDDEKIYALRNILELYSNKLYGSAKNINILLNSYNYVNNGNSLTNEYLNNITYNTQKMYYGDYVEVDKSFSYLWERQSLYFDGFYYLYYIVSIAIASYIVNEINNDNKEILDKYLKFLSCGSDMSLKEIINTLGVDINNEILIKNTIEYYNKILNRYEKLSN